MEKKRVLVLTGSPGVGKTTVLAKVVGDLKARVVKIEGMFSREIREGDARVGFEIVDVSSARIGKLSYVNYQAGPKVGKYHVNIDDLENVGVQAIEKAIEKSDVVVIDEIGPMELFSIKFKEIAQKALDGYKIVLAIVHHKARDKLVSQAKVRPDVQVFPVSLQNREILNDVLVETAMAFLRVEGKTATKPL